MPCNYSLNHLVPGCSLAFCLACNSQHSKPEAEVPDSSHNCMEIPSRFSKTDSIAGFVQRPDTSTRGMVLIPAGVFIMGANNDQASKDEYPPHEVKINAFWMDATEVTNAQFREFVDATSYITTAEKKPDWEELKKSVPPGTEPPPDSLLVPASLVFHQTPGPVDLNDYNQWWQWVPGADWKHPRGPGSSIQGMENYPVVHVSWFDAMAYCKWAGKRLPTEAEWEYAARGDLVDAVYPWGNEHVNSGKAKANSWEGKFPYYIEKKDGYTGLAPVRAYPSNAYGLFDMAGNVWEWCNDWYAADYYKSIAGKTSLNPQGPVTSSDPEDPYTSKKVLRGGSFLCNDSYCSGYRSARRMKSSPDTGLEHTGFRCVKN